MAVEEVPVRLGSRSYGVFVGGGLLGRIEEFLPPAAGCRRSLVVADRTSGRLFADTVLRRMKHAGLEASLFEVEPGEDSKSIEKAIELVDFMARSGLSRADVMVCLGGGVVGDLGAFAASIYKRGIAVLQVPTTLTAQVDSSIGGKTGVNLPSGKNLVGAFHQPVAVVCDVGVLSTLPEREFASGLAEVAKYSFLEPGKWEEPLAMEAGRLRECDPGALARTVARCVGIKAALVALDEFDRGERAFLNYGHTLGHALEAATGYSGTYTHGEAISVGMVFSAMVSEITGVSSGGLSERHQRDLESLGLPTRPFDPTPGFDDLIEPIEHDKKSRGGITIVLLAEEGSPLLMPDVDLSILREAYRRLRAG